MKFQNLLNLDPEFEFICASGNVLTVEPVKHVFSDGAVQVSLDLLSIRKEIIGNTVTIVHRISNANHLMEVLQATDILKHAGFYVSLLLPYWPYARQDRRMLDASGPSVDSYALRVFCDIINAQGYQQVFVLDPHSLQTAANTYAITLLDPIDYVLAAIESFKPTALVSPDKGARAKVEHYAKKSNLPVVYANKVRDVNNHGKIIKTEIEEDSVSLIKDGNLLICDDICDGGATFIELAKVLNAQGANFVGLYVTHGIFSKGLIPLWMHIDTIYTTNSFKTFHGYGHALVQTALKFE